MAGRFPHKPEKDENGRSKQVARTAKAAQGNPGLLNDTVSTTVAT
jgi:hypothetical protein